MSTYQTISVTNKPLQCVIQIDCTTKNVAPGSVTKIRIKRRLNGTLSWTNIGDMAISTTADFTFSVQDPNTRSEYSYDYMIMPVQGEVETVGEVISNIKCSFAAIYVSDGISTYIGALNTDYDITDNHAGTFIEMQYSKYPFYIVNGDMDYSSGMCKALWLPYDVSGNPTETGARAYKDAFKSFLKNGIPKNIKIYDGQVHRVGVEGSSVKETTINPGVASEIQFNWKEIEDFPTTGLVVVT